MGEVVRPAAFARKVGPRKVVLSSSGPASVTTLIQPPAETSFVERLREFDRMIAERARKDKRFAAELRKIKRDAEKRSKRMLIRSPFAFRP